MDPFVSPKPRLDAANPRRFIEHLLRLRVRRGSLHLQKRAAFPERLLQLVERRRVEIFRERARRRALLVQRVQRPGVYFSVVGPGRTATAEPFQLLTIDRLVRAAVRVHDHVPRPRRGVRRGVPNLLPQRDVHRPQLLVQLRDLRLSRVAREPRADRAHERDRLRDPDEVDPEGRDAQRLAVDDLLPGFGLLALPQRREVLARDRLALEPQRFQLGLLLADLLDDRVQVRLRLALVRLAFGEEAVADVGALLAGRRGRGRRECQRGRRPERAEERRGDAGAARDGDGDDGRRRRRGGRVVVARRERGASDRRRRRARRRRPPRRRSGRRRRRLRARARREDAARRGRARGRREDGGRARDHGACDDVCARAEARVRCARVAMARRERVVAPNLSRAAEVAARRSSSRDDPCTKVHRSVEREAIKC
eukprot:29952-Pelagococcus_subviridis.AAC.13